jgi:2TM domain
MGLDWIYTLGDGFRWLVPSLFRFRDKNVQHMIAQSFIGSTCFAPGSIVSEVEMSDVQPPQDERLRAARKYVDNLKGFYVHAVVFAGVMTALFAVNALSGGGWWVQWPFLGWGFGLVCHGLAVRLKASTAIRDWEERTIKQIVGGP